MIADILESAMLIAFGLAWPANIMKTLRTKATTGKSLPFLIMVIVGYAFGLTAKFLRGDFNFVILFYTLNLLLISSDACLYLYYRRQERRLA